MWYPFKRFLAKRKNLQTGETLYMGELLDYAAADVEETQKIYPYKDGDYTSIGPECFTDGKVISYKGENYYKACGATVVELPAGGTSTCIKRVLHVGYIHEDYDGRQRRY